VPLREPAVIIDLAGDGFDSTLELRIVGRIGDTELRFEDGERAIPVEDGDENSPPISFADGPGVGAQEPFLALKSTLGPVLRF
jgi:hypothetical protein